MATTKKITTAKKKTGTELAVVRPATMAVGRFSQTFGEYLVGMGLPSEKILADPEERRTVFTLMPDLVVLLDDTQKKEATYVSKFVAACGAGLFDAALNFMWDEVVERLRRRVAQFDLSYFYDTAVSDPKERKEYSTEADLAFLTDAELIRGALKCGILTEIGYKRLDHIRDMRNWASAAHPNHVELEGLQLVAMFQTCLKEAILKEPEGAVLVVGRFLNNMRTQKWAPKDAPAMIASLGTLTSDLAAALLRSTAGIYCDPKQPVQARDNVRLVAKELWDRAPDGARKEMGLKYANFAVNGEVDRKTLVHEFLELVEGLTYLPKGALVVALSAAIAELESAHDGFDNFYNEPRSVPKLRKLVPTTGKIPEAVNDDYVRVLVQCRIGRPSGVSLKAVPVYDELIGLFEEPQLKAFVLVLRNVEIRTALNNGDCARRFLTIAKRLAVKAVSQPMKNVFDFITKATTARLPILGTDTEFGQLVAKILDARLKEGRSTFGVSRGVC